MCNDNLFSNCKNKLAKLRTHSSRLHFASNNFGPIHFILEHFRLYTLGFEHAGHFIGHLVYFHVGHHVIVQLHGGQLFFFSHQGSSRAGPWAERKQCLNRSYPITNYLNNDLHFYFYTIHSVPECGFEVLK